MCCNEYKKKFNFVIDVKYSYENSILKSNKYSEHLETVPLTIYDLIASQNYCRELYKQIKFFQTVFRIILHSFTSIELCVCPLQVQNYRLYDLYIWTVLAVLANASISLWLYSYSMTMHYGYIQ